MKNNILNQKSENFSEKKLDWIVIQSVMKNKFDKGIYESWIKKIEFINEFNDYILISVSTRFIRDWITSRYLEQIFQIVKLYKKNVNRIEFIIKELENNKIVQRQNEQEQSSETNANVSFIKDSYLQYNRINPNKKFDNFILGFSNKLAYEASKKVSQDISHYNPLYIYGGVGMGKTHLLNAIGLSLKGKNKAMLISAERFMYQFVRSLKLNEMVKFKEYFRNTEVLLIDDIQFMNGKEAMQEEFFHTFNALLEGGQQMILTCDRYPKEIDGLEERLKSRFGWGLTAAVEPPELETRVAILMKKAAQARIDLPPDAAFFIAQRIRSNVRELEGALKRVIASAHFTARPIDIGLVKDSLKDLLALQARQVSLDNIQRTVAEYYKIKVADLMSRRRSRSVARPRQVAMALSKELTNHSLPEIGDSFGGRDHTTVLHGCRKIKELRESNSDIREDYKNLLRSLTT